jgi:hypothetical protein
MMRGLFIIISFLVFLQGNMQGQEVHADAKLDTTDILIGDQINLTIQFTMPLDSRVLWPFYKDTLVNKIEIIDRSPVDTMISEAENIVRMLQTLTITSFDSGYYHIPGMTFAYQPIDDTAFTEINTIPVYLHVHTMEVDTSKAIMAIKPPLGAPFTFMEALPWIMIGLAAIIVVLLVIYLVKKLKKKEPIFTFRPKPILPPHIIAINGLENLKHRKVWQSGEMKVYYTELTDIVRVYIEDRYAVPAVEMTSEEIMEGLKQTNANPDIVEKLRQTLMLADLVKFAKASPMALENDVSMNNSMDFVRETIQIIETAEKEDINNNTEEKEDKK